MGASFVARGAAHRFAGFNSNGQEPLVCTLVDFVCYEAK